MSYTVNQGKELAAAPRVVVFVDFTFLDGSTLYVSNLAMSFGGHSYIARLSENSIPALASLSETGVDRIPSVQFKLADPDAYLWTNCETAANRGFKGADCKITLALMDATTGELSTDSLIPFVGTCDQPGIDDEYLTVTANAKLNLSRFMLPTVRIQRRCPWVNPKTVAQRALASDPDSDFYPCGETRDLTTAPPCQYTKATCTQANRFGGVTWDTAQTGSGREYISGTKSQWSNADTSGKYSEYWPMWFGGIAWLTCCELNQWADGNYNRAEIAVGFGAVDVMRVVVNNIELAGPTTSGDFRWHYVNNGERDGAINQDVPHNGTDGDPYGNCTVIQVLMPKGNWQPDSLATVRVLGRRKSIGKVQRIATAVGSGGRITVTFTGANRDCAGNPPYSVTIVGCSWAGANGTHTLYGWGWGPPGTIILNTTGTGSGIGGYVYYESTGIAAGGGGTSPTAVLQEALTATRYSSDDLNTDSFTNASEICDFETANGTRFTASLALRQQRSASEIVRGIRQSIGALLVPGSDGKLNLIMEGPLAEQQPLAVSGSNYNSAILSTKRDGTAANGYSAYDFDESNCRGLRTIPRPISDMPNKVAFPFQDGDNGYAISQFALSDSDDIYRVDQEQPGGMQCEPIGIASYNHALRCARMSLSKIHRGNSQSDTRGTGWYEWTTSFRACRSAIGQIVRITSTRLGLDHQQIRLTEISPSKNFLEMKLKGHVHSDAWYLDSAGSDEDPTYSRRAHDRLARPAFPWLPFYAAAMAGDSMFEGYTFELAPITELDAQGNWNTRLSVTGKIPPNSFSSVAAPSIAAQATVATTGGSIPASSLVYVAICGKDSSGKPTAPSPMICKADVPATTNTNTVTVQIGQWGDGTTGYEVFAGSNPNKLAWQSDGSGTPTSITLTSIAVNTRGMPDIEYERVLVRFKRARHLGILGTPVASVAANTITIGGTWALNALAGYDVSLVAKADNSTLTVSNFRITANSVGGALTVTPNPVGVVVANDVVVVLSKPTVAGKVVSDARWNNSFSPLYPMNGLAPDEEIGSVLRVIAGRGAGLTYPITDNDGTSVTLATDPDMDSTSRYIIEESAWIGQAYSTAIENDDSARAVTVDLPVTNYRGGQLVIQCVTLDSADSMGFESMAPVRCCYVLGQSEKFRTITASDTQKVDDQNILCDTTAGNITVTLLPWSAWSGRTLTVKKVSADANTVTISPYSGQTTEGTLTLTQQNDGWTGKSKSNG